jgi:hypothetical protein
MPLADPLACPLGLPPCGCSLGLASAGTYAAAAGASACVECGAGKFPSPPGADGGWECARLDIGICAFVPPSIIAASSSLCVCVNVSVWECRSCVCMNMAVS